MFTLFKRNPRNTRKFLKQENEQLKTDYQKEREKCYQAKKQIKELEQQNKELKASLKNAEGRCSSYLDQMINLSNQVLNLREITLDSKVRLHKAEILNEQLLGEFPDDLSNLLNSDNQ
ncbi:hypothetical protein Q0590_08455 [Rhodocytophaga aerolata]|uniref:Uncharacterized protein n=1 Tax=Rhodocytophaga aerolata TaxID=455078 RepID=A0ABT8R2F7_9BACT|nr:hypothetical protein [Rhodocytophaga aerolata]MDO1446280.1 hypothetical protein [Rhodocytophaga aerolata]